MDVSHIVKDIPKILVFLLNLTFNYLVHTPPDKTTDTNCSYNCKYI